MSEVRELVEAAKLARTYVAAVHSNIASAMGHEETVIRPDLERIDAAIAAVEAKLDTGVAPETGITLIAAERQRQIDVEDWTPEHDDAHSAFEMTRAAVSYCFSIVNIYSVVNWWPWDWKWWKPSDDPIRNLVKAGALIAAEIDRLQRAPIGGESEKA